MFTTRSVRAEIMAMATGVDGEGCEKVREEDYYGIPSGNLCQAMTMASTPISAWRRVAVSPSQHDMMDGVDVFVWVGEKQRT